MKKGIQINIIREGERSFQIDQSINMKETFGHTSSSTVNK